LDVTPTDEEFNVVAISRPCRWHGPSPQSWVALLERELRAFIAAVGDL